MVFFIIGCNDENTPISKYDKKIDPHYWTGQIAPSNSSNPYDSAGYYHNECLDYVADHWNELCLDSSLYKSKMNELISDFCCSRGYDVPTSNCEDSIGQIVDDYFTSVSYMNVDQIIENYGLSMLAKDKLYELLNYINILLENDSTETTVIYFINTVKSWESNIINNNNLNSSEKKQILVASSVLRYSVSYWYDVYTDSNSPWRTTLPEFLPKNSKKLPRIQIVPFLFNSYPLWYKIVGTATSDVLGGITFGYVGAATASAVTGYIFWTPQVNAAASWLWGGVTSALTSVCCFLGLCSSGC